MQKELDQLVEIFVMLERGEVSQDYFCRAFVTRFRKQIQAFRHKQFKAKNYGWADLDWSRVEASPLLRQLMREEI